MNEDRVIERADVDAILAVLYDVKLLLLDVVNLLRGEDGEEEEEEHPDR